MSHPQGQVAKGDTIIFLVDEYRNGKPTHFDGEILSVEDKGVDVIYLSGHHSRNDFIPWHDIIAKYDANQPYITLENAPYQGRFVVFDTESETEEVQPCN
ncbi:hypothetical protein [Marinobacterium stanieri]|uniref:hypothetical protein n=1 Tax=Marinobacterium stanieri TaxID=49186 RepID=UPI000255A5CD|nr:hypothetical protein [Marinobacterium stanieri]